MFTLLSKQANYVVDRRYFAGQDPVFKSKDVLVIQYLSPSTTFILTMQCLLCESLIHSIDHPYLVMNNFWWLNCLHSSKELMESMLTNQVGEIAQAVVDKVLID